jgi:hypothetical protein
LNSDPKGDELFDLSSSSDLTLEGAYPVVVLEFSLDRSIFYLDELEQVGRKASGWLP